MVDEIELKGVGQRKKKELSGNGADGGWTEQHKRVKGPQPCLRT